MLGLLFGYGYLNSGYGYGSYGGYGGYGYGGYGSYGYPSSTWLVRSPGLYGSYGGYGYSGYGSYGYGWGGGCRRNGWY